MEPVPDSVLGNLVDEICNLNIRRSAVRRAGNSAGMATQMQPAMLPATSMRHLAQPLSLETGLTRETLVYCNYLIFLQKNFFTQR
jgi:hypothetical protein